MTINKLPVETKTFILINCVSCSFACKAIGHFDVWNNYKKKMIVTVYSNYT